MSKISDKDKNDWKRFIDSDEKVLNKDNLDNDIELLKLKLNIKNEMKHIGKRKKEKKSYSENETEKIINNNVYDIELWNYYKKNIRNLT